MNLKQNKSFKKKTSEEIKHSSLYPKRSIQVVKMFSSIDPEVPLFDTILQEKKENKYIQHSKHIFLSWKATNNLIIQKKGVEFVTDFKEVFLD